MDNELNDEDVWDDSLLIKMYEASQKRINEELTKRIGVQPSLNPISNSENAASSNENVEKKTKLKMSNTPKVSIKQNGVNSVQAKTLDWKEGDFCQLTYSEDNVSYEATIISIDNNEETCIVRYVGYGNEDNANLIDLKPSKGEKVRKLQIEMAIQDGYGEPEIFYDEKPNITVDSLVTKLVPNSNTNQISGTSRIIPPPPLFLNENCNSGSSPNNYATHGSEDDDDVLASMLMSWYMTGYHTGYYQARKDLKNNK